MIRDVLEKSIKTALWSLKIEESKVSKINLEHPEELTHGDYSSNIAMVLAKQVSQNPRELAEKIVAEILERKPKELLKAEVAGPGFINFYLSPEFFILQTKEVLKVESKFGLNKNLKGEKTVIEYTDPNPFKEFHIGHLMSNSIGEAIARITEANGAKVIRACYQGDVGLHVAKAIWGMKNIIGNIKEASDLGKAYMLGSTSYERDERIKREIIEINKEIYNHSNKEVEKLYKSGRKISLKYFESMYKIFGTKFDNYFFESETGDFGKKIVEENIGKIFERGDNNSVIFRGENYGLHTRVFINSEGLPTYEAKELGLAKIKFNKTKYNKSIVITGNEINEYFKVLLKAMSFVFPELAAKTVHLSHGMLRLPDGKMSSRTGDVITAISLLNDVKMKVLEKMDGRGMTKKEKEQVAEKVAVGALKYSILKQVNGKDIIFDFDKSISFEGDSGPYLQYSYVRARSILRKAKEEKIKKIDWKKFSNKNEVLALEKILYRFREVVERAGNEYSPHYIATYLVELASSFNSFYALGKIVDKNEDESSYKVALTEAFSIVIKEGLNLLGIEVPEKM